MEHEGTQLVTVDMHDEERGITMRSIIRQFRMWIVITGLLTLSSMMVLQSMLYRMSQSRQQQLYDKDLTFQKRFLGSYDVESVRILRLGDSDGGKSVSRVDDTAGEGQVFVDRGEGFNENEGEDGDEENYTDEDDDDYDDDDDDDDVDYGEDKNPVFQQGDFEQFESPTKPRFQFRELDDNDVDRDLEVKTHIFHKQTAEFRNTHRKTTKLKQHDTRTPAGLFRLSPTSHKGLFSGPYTNGVYWTEKVDRLVPKGPGLAVVESQTLVAQRQNVTQLQPATWNKCGRTKNGFVLMSDGSGFCARYRAPHQNLILGEVLSYYLSRLLGMDNVPLVVLSHTSSSQWSLVNYTRLEWSSGQIVALIHWTHGLNSPGSQVKMPKLLLDAILTNRTLHPISIANQNLTVDQLMELIQWGEMIIYDYITGNYDRVASMQDGAVRERKQSILTEYIRNLRKHGKTSKLWLIDNESGLLDAYDLLYKSFRNGPTFASFHKQMLHSTCIFRQSTIVRLKHILKHAAPQEVLLSYARRYEPLLDKIERNWLFDVFQVHFPMRLREVYAWVEQCKSAFR